MLLIPAIDLRNGRCVRLFQGDFNAETRYEVEPRELLVRYQALGASWLHVVDLDGAKDGALANRPTIIALAAQAALRLQVGGGVRTQETIEDLLRSGWLACFGAERLCLAFDVRLDSTGEPKVRTRGWTQDSELTLWQALEPFVASGLKHVLCTDIERDGALTGPNLALYAHALRRFPQLAWQASGGVRNAADLAALAHLEVAAAVSGKALLEDRITSQELRPFLPNASSPVSTSATAK
jgi:phosphoribosylformimino-5-aminoimidazole carboxamide ribotide isomerase